MTLCLVLDLLDVGYEQERKLLISWGDWLCSAGLLCMRIAVDLHFLSLRGKSTVLGQLKISVPFYEWSESKSALALLGESFILRRDKTPLIVVWMEASEVQSWGIARGLRCHRSDGVGYVCWVRIGLGSACAGAKWGHISKSVKQSSGNPEAPELTTPMNFHTSDPAWAPLLIICGLFFPMVPLIWQKSLPDSQFTDFYCLHSTFGSKHNLGNAIESVKHANLWMVHHQQQFDDVSIDMNIHCLEIH